MPSQSNELDKQVHTYFDENNIYNQDGYWASQAYDTILSKNVKDCSVLEFGIGMHRNVLNICKYAAEVDILEGSPAAIRNFKEKHPDLASEARIRIFETFFEDYSCDKKYDRIAMDGILEHVEDPFFLLKKYRDALCDDGKLIVKVPNAESLHRRIGHKMGLLDDMEKLSQGDLDIGHKRYFHLTSMTEMLESAGYAVIDSKGLYLKPLTSSQLEQLKLGPSFYKALSEVACEYPELCNLICIVAEKR